VEGEAVPGEGLVKQTFEVTVLFIWRAEFPVGTKLCSFCDHMRKVECNTYLVFSMRA